MAQALRVWWWKEGTGVPGDTSCCCPGEYGLGPGVMCMHRSRRGRSTCESRHMRLHLCTCRTPSCAASQGEVGLTLDSQWLTLPGSNAGSNTPIPGSAWPVFAAGVGPQALLAARVRVTGAALVCLPKAQPHRGQRVPEPKAPKRPGGWLGLTGGSFKCVGVCGE